MRATSAPVCRGTGHLVVSLLLLLVGITLPTTPCCADDCPPGTIQTIAGGGAGDGGLATNVSLWPSGVEVGPDGSIYIADNGSMRSYGLPVARIRKVTPHSVITTIASLRGQLRGVALAADGSLYVADAGDYCVHRVDPNGVISRAAGTGEYGHSGDGGAATSARFQHPLDVAIGRDGSVYVADAHAHRVRKIDTAGVITTVAGDGWTDDKRQGRFAGDDGPANEASPNLPGGITVGPEGSLYIADTGNGRIRKVDPDGIITTVAGSGPTPFREPGTGDGGVATEALLAAPCDVAVTADGTLYVATSGAILKVDPAGIITTVAGNEWRLLWRRSKRVVIHDAYPGDGTPPAEVLIAPSAVSAAPNGSLYIADGWHRRILRLDPGGVLTAVAGNGEDRYSGNGGPAARASLAGPSAVVVKADGTLYIADTDNRLVRKVGPDGVINTVAGRMHERSILATYGGDGGPATEALLRSPNGVALAADGALYIADTDGLIRKVAPGGTITTVAGNHRWTYAGDGGAATQASLNHPSAVAVDAEGNLYIADTDNHAVRKVDTAGIITTVAGNGSADYAGDGGPAVQASLDHPWGVAVGADGTLYIADAGNNRVRKVDTAGIITTVAGTRSSGYTGDGGPAIRASLNDPYGVAVGPDGTLYIADTGNRRVRKVNPAGIITTVAGSGAWLHSGDGGPATEAGLAPRGLAVDADGNVYIADSENTRIRKICASQMKARAWTWQSVVPYNY